MIKYSRTNMYRVYHTILCLILCQSMALASVPWIEESIRKADNFIGEENYQEAILLLDSIKDDCYQSTDNAIIFSYNYIKGSAYYSLGEYDKSLSLFIESSKYDMVGSHMDVFETIGNIYLYEFNDYYNAKLYLQKGLIRYNEYMNLSIGTINFESVARCCYMLGFLYVNEKNIYLANNCYEILQSIEIDGIEEIRDSLSKLIYLSNSLSE